MGVEQWGELNKQNWKDYNGGGMKQGAARERKKSLWMSLSKCYSVPVGCEELCR